MAVACCKTPVSQMWVNPICLMELSAASLMSANRPTPFSARVPFCLRVSLVLPKSLTNSW